MKFIILLILPLIFLTYGIQNIPEIDARSATEPCSYQKSNSFLKISNEPWTCKKVDYWVPERCGIHEGIYKTDVACQKPAPVAPAPVAPAPVAPAPVAPAPVAPAPVPEIQDSESPNYWLMIAGIVIVFVIGGVIYKKFLNPKVGGYQKYTGSKEKPEDGSGFEKEPHDYSKESNDPMYPTYEDLKNNFARFGWEDAEDLTAKLFKSKGYSTTVGVPTKDGGRKRQGDFGIDVRAHNGIVNIGIQVKHQVENVDFDAVAKTLGVAQKFQKVIIVSTKSGFSTQSLEHARNNSDVIELWDSDTFKEEIKKHLIEKDNSQFEEPEPKQKSDFNYYEILGASRNDTQEEIKQKYKELSLKFHPDKAKSALSENMMKQVNEAYAVLRDADKRRQYDAKLDSA
jgi:hypothetical protein